MLGLAQEVSKSDEVQGPPTPSSGQKEAPASLGDTNLATLKEDVPGGGTALPFGQQEGKLDGYNTTPDPQVGTAGAGYVPDG